MPPVLSLCFPTFNRASLLAGALQAALSQITPPMAELVEVLVLDNASPDGTPDVVERMQASFAYVSLRSIRRPENIGCDANFCTAPTLARGQFVYLLSDDDILLPGAVSTLLDLIQKNPDLDAFSLNVRLFWDSPEEEGTAQPYTLDQDRLLQTKDETLALLKEHIVFISCLAFRRANVVEQDYSSRYGTNLAQAYVFLDALLPGRGVYATARPHLAQRAGKAEGYNFFKVWVSHFAALMCYAEEIGYSRQTVRRVMEQHLGFIYHYVLTFKKEGHYDQLRPDYWDAWIRLWRTYRFSRYLWAMILPKMLVPGVVFARLQSAYLLAKSRLLRQPAAVPQPSEAPP